MEDTNMARERKDGEFVNVKVRQDIADRLNQYTKESMIPKTALVEKAIEEYLDRNAPVKKSNKKS